MDKPALPLRTEHSVGVLLVVVSALVFSTVGIFTKGVEADAWSVIFWRGVFATLFTGAYVIGKKRFQAEFLHMGRSGILAAVVGASATAAFLSAFKLTSIANVALIWAAAPVFSALIAYLWIRERLSRIQVIACATTFAGVLIIVQGSLGSIHFKGDLLALWMVIGMSVFMVIYRRWPQTPAAGPAALSSVLLLPFGLWFTNVFSISGIDFVILAVFGLVFAIASVTFGEGVKRITAGETALLSMLEVPIAPILAFLIFNEMPPAATFIGGGMVFVAVLVSQLKTSRPAITKRIK